MRGNVRGEGEEARGMSFDVEEGQMEGEREHKKEVEKVGNGTRS